MIVLSAVVCIIVASFCYLNHRRNLPVQIDVSLRNTLSIMRSELKDRVLLPHAKRLFEEKKLFRTFSAHDTIETIQDAVNAAEILVAFWKEENNDEVTYMEWYKKNQREENCLSRRKSSSALSVVHILTRICGDPNIHGDPLILHDMQCCDGKTL